jgi:hypothetical protein
MGCIEVLGGSMDGDKIASLQVKIPRLPPRTIDRDTAVRWMKDGHSFLPTSTKRALQLVEVGDDDQPFIRDDHEKVAADKLPF